MKKRNDLSVSYDGKPFETIRELLASAAADAGFETAFRYRKGGSVLSVTYAAFFEEVKALGSALVKEGLFGAHTAFWAKNSKELLTSLLTVLATPGTALPLPADATADDAMELLRAGDARLLFLDLSLYRAHKNLLKRLTGLRRLVVFGLPMDEECDFVTGSAISYDRLLALGRALLQTDGTAPETERFLSAPLSEDEPRLLLFPAGDAVAMRGIMFSERNLRAGVLGVAALLPAHRCALSVLPCHLPEELVCSLLLSVCRHAALCICASPADVMDDFKIFKPDSVVLSSLFVEKLAASIRESLVRRGKSEAFGRLLRASDAMRRAGVDRRRAVFRAVHDAFGGELQRILCVGAPLPEASADFFEAVGIELFTGYSVPECLPFAAVGKGGSAKESGGRPGVRAGTLLPGLTAYISDGTAQNELPAEDSGAAKRFFRKLPFFRSTRPGEILLSGDCVAMGLYNDPAGTRALFPGDRLLRTGEFGSLDGRGRLTVTGRRRNLLSFKSGKTVSPEELEILLAGIPYIGDAVVFAAGEAETGVELRLCAEVTLREETVRALTKEQRLALVKREISALNASLPPYKRLRQVRIRTEGGTPASEEAPDPVLPPEDLPAETTAETPAGAPEQAQPAPEAASSSEPAPEKSKDPGDAGL